MILIHIHEVDLVLNKVRSEKEQNISVAIRWTDGNDTGLLGRARMLSSQLLFRCHAWYNHILCLRLIRVSRNNDDC